MLNEDSKKNTQDQNIDPVLNEIRPKMSLPMRLGLTKNFSIHS
jgi:hypothetical protein